MKVCVWEHSGGRDLLLPPHTLQNEVQDLQGAAVRFSARWFDRHHSDSWRVYTVCMYVLYVLYVYFMYELYVCILYVCILYVCMCMYTLCMYVYVCMYVCLYVCMKVWKYVYCMYMYVCILSVCVCMCKYMDIWISILYIVSSYCM